MSANILIVDDNPGLIQVMGRILAGLGQVCFATNGIAALRQMRKVQPDLVFLDAEMPGISGFEVCRQMQADASLKEVPVIFVTSFSGPDFELKGLECGAVDYIAKPISEALLLARAKTQLRTKRLADELRAVSNMDALTELANRRSFDSTLVREWRRSQRAAKPIGLLMIDVDHFKLYNDHYGHPAGDECLRRVALALTGVSNRPGDLVARYGGEEFVLLLPDTSRAGAQHVARKVLGTVAQLKLPHQASPTATHVSVSVGVSSYDLDSPSWTGLSIESRFLAEQQHESQDLLRCADQALYVAKSQGRARGCWLDIDDVDAPMQSRSLMPEQPPEALSEQPVHNAVMG